MAEDPIRDKMPEARLVECSANGTFWEPDKVDGKEPDMNPANAATWNDRVFSADSIRRLAIGDPNPDTSIPSSQSRRPLLIRGARITGNLDLRGATLKRALWLEHCAFDEMIQLSDCETKTISLRGSRLRAGLRAKRATINGSLFLNDGFVAEGEVNLEDSTIQGNLDCGGGRFGDKANPQKHHALCTDNSKIAGDVRLNINADPAPDVVPIAEPKRPFEAWGEVRFVGATVAGDFDCDGGLFHNPGGIALFASGMSCRKLFMQKPFVAEGTVNLSGLHANEQVACLGGRFLNDGGDALTFRFAVIGSALLFAKAYNHKIKTDDDKEDREAASICGRLDLSQASCRIFRDHSDAWPPIGMLLLDGFTYERFHDCNTDWKTRRDWLNRQVPDHLNAPFRPQPWTQAINVLRATGCEGDSKELAVCREVTRARSNRRAVSRQWRGWKLTGTIGSFWSEFLRLAVGYGYMPWRAFRWSIVFFLIGWVTFALAANLGFMAPREASVQTYLASPELKRNLPEHYTRFNAALFALDNFLPIIELGQDQAWEPSDTQTGYRRTTHDGWLTEAVRLALGHDWRVTGKHTTPADTGQGILDELAAVVAWTFSLGLHRLVYWTMELLGWVFVSLFIAGMSGIMKKE